MVPLPLPRNELAAGTGVGAIFQRVLRQARAPRSLPALFVKNIRYAFASRRPSYWNQLGRGLAARERYEEALAALTSRPLRSSLSLRRRAVRIVRVSEASSERR